MRRERGQKRFEGDGGAEGVSMGWLEDRKGFWDVRVRILCFFDFFLGVARRERGKESDGVWADRVVGEEEGVCGLGEGGEERADLVVGEWFFCIIFD